MPMTRWYDGDPADWAKNRGWKTLLLQALTMDEQEEEQSFWPERFTVAELQKERQAAPMAFALQMMNEIVPWEGQLFKREWFRNRFDFAPPPEDILVTCASWDTAGSITGRSYTVGLVLAVTKGWRYHIVQMVRGKVEYPELRALIKDTANRFKVQRTFIEAKSSGLQAFQELSRDPSVYGSVLPLQPAGQRGGPPSRQSMEWVDSVTVPFYDGRVWLPSKDFCLRHNIDDWTGEFLAEMLSYPEGRNDDIVVALTQVVHRLEEERLHWTRQEEHRKQGQLRYAGSGGTARLLT
jgi:predicted phage terminase large subunit-like protein